MHHGRQLFHRTAFYLSKPTCTLPDIFSQCDFFYCCKTTCTMINTYFKDWFFHRCQATCILPDTYFTDRCFTVVKPHDGLPFFPWFIHQRPQLFLLLQFQFVHLCWQLPALLHQLCSWINHTLRKTSLKKPPPQIRPPHYDIKKTITQDPWWLWPYYHSLTVFNNSSYAFL